MDEGRFDPFRYLDGLWRNDACMGYALMAMRNASIGEDDIQKVMKQMIWCFDDTTVEEAAKYYCGGGR